MEEGSRQIKQVTLQEVSFVALVEDYVELHEEEPAVGFDPGFGFFLYFWGRRSRRYELIQFSFGTLVVVDWWGRHL